jgi:hypothetical protein
MNPRSIVPASIAADREIEKSVRHPLTAGSQSKQFGK